MLQDTLGGDRESIDSRIQALEALRSQDTLGGDRASTGSRIQALEALWSQDTRGGALACSAMWAVTETAIVVMNKRTPRERE